MDVQPSSDPSMTWEKCTCDLCSCARRGKLNVASKNISKLPPCVLALANLTSASLNYNNFNRLPATFSSTPLAAHLQTLNLKGNNLRELPSNLGAMRSLQELDLSENMLTMLPDTFTELCNLRIFKCVDNMLKQLPDQLATLVALEELHLDENKFRALPDSFGTLAALQSLEMSNNKLSMLPANVGDLRRLVCLNLSYNPLSELPPSFDRLDSLEELDLSYCRLKFLPETFPSAPRMRKLYCDSNSLCTLPAWISAMGAIEELSFEDNHLVKSPFAADFGTTCASLRHFNFGGNFMEWLPETMGQLTAVEFVHLGSTLHELERRNFQNGNWIAKLPDGFGHMRALTHLRLDENQLNYLPESFGELVSLEALDLGQNKLNELPANFGLLRSLKTCQLSKNFLVKLPDNFGKLSALTEARLDNNLLLELPDSFDDLTQLEVLDLFNNELSNIPRCLQYMDKLKYLELDENNFGVALEEVPRIVHHTTYADRNPELANSWRGKGRNEGKPALQSEKANKLLNALQQGSALWKTHSGDGVREKFDHQSAKSHAPMKMDAHNDFMNSLAGKLSDIDLNCSRTTSDSDCASQASENENWDIDQITDFTGSANDPNVEDDYEPEDWDKELEEYDRFNVYDDYSDLRQKIAKPLPYYLPPSNGFLPSDGHPSSILRCRFTYNGECAGQFDDAE